MDEKMTKRELKELRRMERASQHKDSGSTDSMKWIIIAIGSALFLAFFAFTIILIKQSKNKPVAISASGWVRGNENAKTTLVEFGDFQCPACRAAEPFVRQAMHEFNGKIKLQFKDFPLTSVHPNAMLGAKAAEAAGAQGKFWEMHDWLYDNQEAWSLLDGAGAQDKIMEGAKALKLDIVKFTKDLKDSATEAKVTAMQNEGIDLGVAATPTFFINDKKVEPNPSSYDEFKQVIQAAIK